MTAKSSSVIDRRCGVLSSRLGYWPGLLKCGGPCAQQAWPDGSNVAKGRRRAADKSSNVAAVDNISALFINRPTASSRQKASMPPKWYWHRRAFDTSRVGIVRGSVARSVIAAADYGRGMMKRIDDSASQSHRYFFFGQSPEIKAWP